MGNYKRASARALAGVVIAAGFTAVLASSASAIVAETDTVLIDGAGMDLGG